VTLGIRPHDVTLCGSGEADLALEVDFVETMGPDVHVHAELAGAPFVIVLPGAPKIERGAPLPVRVTALHLFDAQTGASLRDRG
jgi:multiple sugar transport system ATP-binding protein